jgi:hypothetical protein
MAHIGCQRGTLDPVQNSEKICRRRFNEMGGMGRKNMGDEVGLLTRPRLVTGTLPVTKRDRVCTSFRAANVGDSTNTGVYFTLVPCIWHNEVRLYQFESPKLSTSDQ